MNDSKPKSVLPVLLTLLVVLLLPHGVWANGNTMAPFKKVIHTVKPNENLWEIARFFGVGLGNITSLNQLENPDLIFPGDQLVIEVQEDFSIRVTESIPPVAPADDPQLETERVEMEVVYPDKNDLFSPENPLVEYKKKTEPVLSQERPRVVRRTRVFSGFLEFVQWLMSESIETRQTQATGSPQISPSPSNPFFLFQMPVLTGSDGQGVGVHISELAPPQYHPDSTAPPPKS